MSEHASRTALLTGFLNAKAMGARQLILYVSLDALSEDGASSGTPSDPGWLAAAHDTGYEPIATGKGVNAHQAVTALVTRMREELEALRRLDREGR